MTKHTKLFNHRFKIIIYICKKKKKKKKEKKCSVEKIDVSLVE